MKKERAGRKNSRALEFTEMIETLTASGLSLQESLEMLASSGDSEKKPGRSGGAAGLAEEILAGIEQGASFADTVCSMETVFPPLFRGMIAAGDRAGSVERIFPRLAAWLREEKAIREKTASALVYPALVLAAAVIMSIVLAAAVFPRLEDIFSAFSVSSGGGSAPGETVRRNIAAVKHAALWSGAFFAFLASGTALLKIISGKSEKAAVFLDRLTLALPLAGKYAAFRETFNFCFALEVLVSGGISLDAGLEIAEAVLSNRIFRGALAKVREAVLSGGSLSAAFLETGVFPRYFCRWASIGESAGQGGEIFSRARMWFQQETEKMTARFLLLVEPALIIGIGLLVLILVSAVILPVFQAYGNLI